MRWRTQRTLQALSLRAPMGRSNLSCHLVHTVCSTVQTEVCTPESEHSFWTADFSPPNLFCRLRPALTGKAQGLRLGKWCVEKHNAPYRFCLRPALTGEAQGLRLRKKVRWRTQRTLQVLSLRGAKQSLISFGAYRVFYCAD